MSVTFTGKERLRARADLMVWKVSVTGQSDDSVITIADERIESLLAKTRPWLGTGSVQNEMELTGIDRDKQDEKK